MLAVLTPFNFLLDPPLLSLIQSLKEQAPLIPQFGSWIGKSGHFWTLVIASYFVFLLARYPKETSLSFAAAVSSLLTGLATLPLKFVFLRARPASGLGPLSFFHLEGITKDAPMYQSFPSGDTAVVAGAAGYLFFASGKKPWKWLLLLLPLASAWARVSLDRHWPSDTFLSIGLGLIIGHLTCQCRKSLPGRP